SGEAWIVPPSGTPSADLPADPEATAAGPQDDRPGPLPSLTGQASALQEALQTFIVFLEDTFANGDLSERAEALMRSLGLKGGPSLVFDWLNGFVLQATASQAQRLNALGAVSSLEMDAQALSQPFLVEREQLAPEPEPELASIAAYALSSYANSSAASGETLPWGVRAVWQGEDISLRGNAASDTYAFVIDSGVLSSTGDLNLASSWHRSWVSGETAFTDGNGHGTHVAGTIAALANGKGVVGVAPGAQVVSLKVFNSSGGGASFSSIIDAVNHAVGVIHTNQLDKNKVVINMSLGGGFSASLDTAIRNAAGQGIRFAVAAGNSGQDADGTSPAAAGDHVNVFTVSAVDSTYTMASWSNWDRIDSLDAVDDVDFAAPGVNVLSYYQNGQLQYLSGTSMASPHVAGLLLMGGVQAGDLVRPITPGTADPFALGVSADTPQPDPSRYIWGSDKNDNLSGGSGADRISGVLASGTSATALGARQIDTLNGGAGMDVFVLGDRRGVFYDDRNKGNLGSDDYALIQDFRPGEDKLQLRQGNYLFTVDDSSLSLYWDRTGIGVLNSSGGNQDELIARLLGVSTLTSADILWA
ncbi:MAG: S8 family serine peptidase, partial [Synechococcaceae cyanobacterium]|nr:S8 family serine peptidase [Synechococcaceae cyanobacterium]